jgi:hypothetical protein
MDLETLRRDGVPLHVSYKDRHVAKQLGARWVPATKQWVLKYKAACDLDKHMWHVTCRDLWDGRLEEGGGMDTSQHWYRNAYTGGNGWTQWSESE